MIHSVFLIVCAFLVFACCTVLIFHHDYEDGLIGRIGLALMGLAAFSRVHNGFIVVFLDGDVIPITNIGNLLWTGAAIFLTRHTARFLWRRQTMKGSPEWRMVKKY